MVILNNIFGPIAEQRAVSQSLGHPKAGLLGWMSGNQTEAGVSVDDETAMMYAPALAATRLLASSIASLRIDLLRDGNRSNPSRQHPVFRLLNRSPAPYVRPFMFRASRAAMQINQGNAYAEIERGNDNRPLALHPIHSSRVVVVKGQATGEPIYAVRNNDGSPAVPIAARDMLHLPSDISEDGICGKGMVELMRESLGMGIATERQGATFFGNGAVPEGILKHPGTLEPEARKNLRREWKQMHQGKRELGILWEGMDYMQTSIAPEQAQFLQTRKYNGEVIAQAYCVQQHLIGILDRSTNNNIEHQSKEFVRYSLLRWLRIWEQEIAEKLLTAKERDELTVRFATEEFELIELANRTQAMNDLWMNGGITLDERRQQEGMDPYNLPGVSDVPWMPLNLVPAPMALAQAEALVKQNEQTGEPMELPEDSPDLPQEDDAGDVTRTALRDATRDTVVNDLRRMMSVEATAAKRAAKKPGEFLAWLDEFYGQGHYSKLLGAIGHSVRAWQIAGSEGEAVTLARSWCERSRQELLNASDGNPNEFEQRVNDTVDGWKLRPLEACEEQKRQSREDEVTP